ncbi:hypothetical protein AB6A40_003232 [Gnathostoma spinigerum]|uniref:LITAF domain-containing protein n=1 Tax=Gnathostoma spinigerum TaxID=75299 RepID=A0ABD6E8X6_9BILA
MDAPPPPYSGTVPNPNSKSPSTNILLSSPPLNLVQATTPRFGPNPIEIDCPFCQVHVVTTTEYVAGALPWIIMAGCFLLGFFLIIPWCLCCVPFCIDACLDVVHSCPACKRILGRHKQL